MQEEDCRALVEDFVEQSGRNHLLPTVRDVIGCRGTRAVMVPLLGQVLEALSGVGAAGVHQSISTEAGYESQKVKVYNNNMRI